MNLWKALFICLHQGPLKLLLQKVNSFETKLKDYKKLFKDVVGKLVKKVKSLEVKLRTKKRKIVVSDSDQEEEGKQDVDLDALHAFANASVTVDSNIPPGGASYIPTASISVPAAVPTGASTVPAGSPNVPADVPPSVAPAGVSNKGKSLIVEEDIPVKERTFKQMQEDILGKQAAKRLHDEEQAELDRQRAELQRRRQHEVLDSAMYYSEQRKGGIGQAQQRTYMRQFVKNQSSAVYTTGWSMDYVKSFTDDQLKEEFEKIQKVQSNSQIQAFSRTLKRTGSVLEDPSSKRQKSTEAPIPSVLEVLPSPVVSSPLSSGTKRKSLGRKRLTKPQSKLDELDLDADNQTFIKVVSNEDSDNEAPILWSALVGWKVISTPLGDINALYRIDQSTKHLTTLRQILHMVDRQDLVKLYGLVVQYYENHHVTSAGLILWGDLQVMEKMLRHKLEIDKDVVGNDMTIAEQLIQFITN
nr:aminoacyl-tRNA synthetase, class 1a, anticodon-binding [Tanacetum cinerariifolium]